jgi:hypothetical protein
MAKKSGSKTSDAKPKADAAPPLRWQQEPAAHDYPAAASFLSLICSPSEVARLVAALRKAPVVTYKAKDLLRSAGLPLLPVDNPHVASDLTKVEHGTALSPVLLVRGSLTASRPLTVADGYHRICASYDLDENADIPCQLVDLGSPGRASTTA